MIAHLRLWRQFVVMAFVREAEYRVSFFMNVGVGLAQLALAVFAFEVIYGYTDQVAGWSRAQVLVLVGIYHTVQGLISLQMAPNLLAISGYVRRGDLDF